MLKSHLCPFNFDIYKLWIWNWDFCLFIKKNMWGYIKICISFLKCIRQQATLLWASWLALVGLLSEYSERYFTKLKFWLFTYLLTKWLWAKVFTAVLIHIYIERYFGKILILRNLERFLDELLSVNEYVLGIAGLLWSLFCH